MYKNVHDISVKTALITIIIIIITIIITNIEPVKE